MEAAGQRSELELEGFLVRCFNKLMSKGFGCIGESCCKCVHIHAGEGLFKTLWRKMGRVKGDGRQNVPTASYMSSLEWCL